jgi:hypothetical protein
MKMVNKCVENHEKVWKHGENGGGCDDENDDGVDDKKESNGSKPSNSKEKI